MTEFLKRFVGATQDLFPLLATAAVFLAVLWLIDRALRRTQRLGKSEGQFRRQMIMAGVSLLGVLLCLLSLPVDDETKHDLLTVFGLVVTAVITLSSTTFAANAMAGLMLRSMNKFRPGDFVRVEDQFGRVTERGLFHTEIQTEDRDLTSLPNMFLIQRPVTVVHATGTIVSAHVSLGYDNAHDHVEAPLMEAARAAGLDDPFVRITELKDFTVEYRVAGFLADVKQLLGTRSRLRGGILHALHETGIEVASPALMIQRPLAPDQQIRPRRVRGGGPIPNSNVTETAEKRIFDKAENAARLEQLKELHGELQTQVQDLEAQLGQPSPEDRESLEQKLKQARKRLEGLESSWDTIEERLKR